jgi:hypothetical protein
VERCGNDFRIATAVPERIAAKLTEGNSHACTIVAMPREKFQSPGVYVSWHSITWAKMFREVLTWAVLSRALMYVPSEKASSYIRAIVPRVTASEGIIAGIVKRS